MDDKLFEVLTSRDLTVRVGRKPHSGRAITQTVPAERTKATLLYLQKRLNRIVKNSPPKIWRQIGNEPAAEAMVVDTPNGNSSLEFGSHKFVDQLVQAYFVHEYYPELFSVLLVDNPSFVAELDHRVQGLPRSAAPTRSEPKFVAIVWCLSVLGPRALGGRKLEQSFRKLRIRFSIPKRPKKKVFRRGYNDQGSLAPDDTKIHRQVDGEYQDILKDLFWLAKEGVNSNYSLNFRWTEEGMYFTATAESKTDYLDDWIRDEDKIVEFHKLCDSLVTFNELSGELVARELNQIARRG